MISRHTRKKLGLRLKLTLIIVALGSGLIIQINLLWLPFVGNTLIIIPGHYNPYAGYLIVYIWELVMLGVIGLLAYMVLGQLLKPIEEVRQGSDRVGRGDLSYRLFINSNDELEELGTAFNQMAAKLEELYHGLQEDRARLEASLNGINIGFIMTDDTMNIITINQAAMSLLAKLPSPSSAASEEWGINLIAKQLSHKTDIVSHLHRALIKKESIQLTSISSGDFILDIFIAPILAGPNVFGTVMVVNNVTEARIADRSKNEFFSIASHELRTPLTIIKGNTSLIQRYYGKKLKDPQLQGMITDIYQSSVRLIQIVNDFLDTSRIEQNRIQFIIQEIDLDTLVAESIHEMESLARGKKLKIIKKVVGKLPLVAADRNRIKQVLFNLIDNAIKYTSSGNIIIQLRHDGNFVKVSVIDTGSGVPLKNRGLLFHKFQQASSNPLTRDATRGTGLGLFISKSLIEGMGGKIYLSHSSKKGSEFVFTVPIALSKLAAPDNSSVL